MEISLFSKCIKDLIAENDRVVVPYLGTFTAEMMPASYSDRQTTILPPYRKMTFHKENVDLSDGKLLLDKVVAETGVSFEQAGVDLGWCLSRLCSELEGHKSCKLPGLGVMRANARNEFFFVPDDDLDIWPDGIGFEAISIKVSEKQPEFETEEPTELAKPTESAEPAVVGEPKRKNVLEYDYDYELEPENPVEETLPAPKSRKRMKPVWIVLIVVAVLLLLFVAACYLFTDEMSPILDRLLYSKEELELLGR